MTGETNGAKLMMKFEDSIKSNRFNWSVTDIPPRTQQGGSNKGAMETFRNMMHRAAASIAGRIADESVTKGIFIRCSIGCTLSYSYTLMYTIFSREVDH